MEQRKENKLHCEKVPTGQIATGKNLMAVQVRWNVARKRGMSGQQQGKTEKQGRDLGVGERCKCS